MTEPFIPETSRHTTQAQQAMKEGMARLLRQRGDLNFNSLVTKGCGIEIALNYEDGARGSLPSDVSAFVNSQYPGRDVGIGRIKFHYHQYKIQDGWSRMLDKGEVSTVDIKVNHLYSATELEREKDWEGVIIPGEGKVKSTSLHLLLHKDPLVYSFFEANVKDWISEKGLYADAFASGSVNHELNPEIAMLVTSLIPDSSSRAPFLDKVIDLPWIPVAIRGRLHEYRRNKLDREDHNHFSVQTPDKYITIFHG